MPEHIFHLVCRRYDRSLLFSVHPLFVLSSISLLLSPRAVLKSTSCPCNQQQGSAERYPVSSSSILAGTLCPDVCTSVLRVFILLSMSVFPPSSCGFFPSLFPQTLPQLLSSCVRCQRQGQVVHHRRGRGGVRAAEPVCSRGSWVAVLH